jgi:hypothetical protein
MKKTMFTALWMVFAAIIGLIGFCAFMLHGATQTGTNTAAVQDWLDHHHMALESMGRLCTVLPTWALMLGIYGVLPGTRPNSPVASTDEDTNPLNSLAGLLSITWMLGVFAIIHYTIRPHHVTFGFFWLLLFFLIGSQIAIGFILAHIGFRCRIGAGRIFATFAAGVFAWFLWGGFVPLVVQAF